MKTTTFQVAVVLATFAATPVLAQTQQGPSDPGIMAARMATGALQGWLSKAADQMSEADYAFRPTPEVRTFGQVLAHVADQDYHFCAAAAGEKPPVREIEKNETTRAGIRKALSEAFAYCDGVYAAMTEAGARKVVELDGRPLPAVAVLIFRTHHSALHYGNVVTYMRLRGKVPSSSAASNPPHDDAEPNLHATDALS